MLIFIPPSETKAFPADAPPAEFGSLVLPELAPTRTRLVKALARLSRGRAPAALEALGLSQAQAGELACNRELLTAPAGAAAEVYTGVLYDALDLPALHRQGVGCDSVLIFSGLWGVLRPGDRIPHYRCSAGVKLPVIGSVSAAWRKALRAPLAAHAAGQLVVDLRSGAYAGLWSAGGNTVTVRVLHEREAGGVLTRSVVSHFNKATKGRLTRALLESGEQPGQPEELADLVRALGYTVEPGPVNTRPDAPVALDIVVRELLLTFALFSVVSRINGEKDLEAAQLFPLRGVLEVGRKAALRQPKGSPRGRVRKEVAWRHRSRDYCGRLELGCCPRRSRGHDDRSQRQRLRHWLHGGVERRRHRGHAQAEQRERRLCAG
jgi:cytoplasmic iron level regulating protein YaaA (DUF328/UPF0246 family)